MTAYRFTVDFDAEADVWYVVESTLPGLRTEADSLDALVKKLRAIVPDLLAALEELGGETNVADEIPIEVVLHTNAQARRPAA